MLRIWVLLMAFTTLASVKTSLDLTGDASEDAQLSKWLTQAHRIILSDLRQDLGNLIEAVTTANPAVVTSRGHGYRSGQTINITDCDASPTINGPQVATRINDDTFSVPVNTAAGTAGTVGWCNRVYVGQIYGGTGTKILQVRQRPLISVQNLWYDASAYGGTNPQGAFDSTTLLTVGVDYVVLPDNDDTGWNHAGHITRISGYWLRPDERVRGLLVASPGQAIGNIRIDYTAGWGYAPNDLEYAENLVVAGLRSMAAVGGPLASESLDYYQYQRMADAEAVKTIGDVDQVLSNYRVWRFG